MTLSRPARPVAGGTLLTVPTIAYGGLTVLAVVTRNAHGLSADGLELSNCSRPCFEQGTLMRGCSSSSPSCSRSTWTPRG